MFEKVRYRPGRYQVLTGEQEILLKQTLAYVFKYFGYDIDIDPEDLKYKECFIASTSTTQLDESQLAPISLANMITKASTSGKSTTSSKRRGFFRKHIEEDSPPHDSRRMLQIQTQSSQERYYPVITPSQKFYEVFGH